MRTGWRALHAASIALLVACAQVEERAAQAAEASDPAASEPQDPPWPDTRWDLPPHPDLRFARLPNGLRLGWMHRARPPGRCSLRLVVHVGSLDEADGERGMAHFVEHMAFNGTARFRGTSILDWFAKQGMAAGRDVNAFTSFVHTIYCIDLASADCAAIAEGLDVLRQFAHEITFDPAEVEAEKGVVDAEERERGSPGRRAREELWLRLAAGTRHAERVPIGVRAERERFDAASLRAFHARWYRPDNMTLLLVGDVEGVGVPPLVEAAFGAIPRPAEPLPVRAPLGAPTRAETFVAVEQPDQPRLDVAILAFGETGPSVWKAEDERERARFMAALMVVSRSVRTLWADEYGFTVLDYDVSFATELGPGVASARDAMFRITCAGEHAERAITFAAALTARAGEPANTERVFEEVRDNLLVAAQRGADAGRDAPNSAVADWLAQRIAQGEAPVARERLWQEWRDAIAPLDAATCSALVRETWSREPTIALLGPRASVDRPEAAWRRGRESVGGDDVGAAANATAEDWPYAASAADVPLPSARTATADGSIDVRFANGVRALVRRTDFAADEILVAACFGSGPLGVDRERIPHVIAWQAASRALELEGVPRDALDRHLGTRRAGATFRLDSGHFSYQGTTNRASLPFQLELLCACLANPRFGDEAAMSLERVRASDPQRTRRSLFGAFLERQIPVLAGIDPLDREAEFAVGVRDVEEFVRPILASSPLTVVAVGDLDVDATVSALARTFGRMPARTPSGASLLPVIERPIRSGVHGELEIETADRRALVSVVVPLPADFDWFRDVDVRLLLPLLQQRLYALVREQLGEAYTIDAELGQLDHGPRSHFLWFATHAAPDAAPRVRDAMVDVATAFASGGVAPAELDAARDPILTGIAADRRTNRRWLVELGRAHERPDALEGIVQLEPRLRAVTAEEVTAAARRFLTREHLSTSIVRPKAAR